MSTGATFCGTLSDSPKPHSMEARMDQDKDGPPREDIRQLGRLLGDTVREQRGEASFALVERIRQLSVRFHRDDDEAARAGLESTLDALSREETIDVVRAFSYFSHLANIATAVTGRLEDLDFPSEADDHALD